MERNRGRAVLLDATPGFVWHGRLRTVGRLWIDVRDCLLATRGNMLVKIASVFPIADASGPEIDQGASLRWIGESMWFPYAFVGDQVQWEAIDDSSARVTLRQDGLPATAVVDVDADGRLTGFRADRYRDIGGGRAVLTPFTGRSFDYTDFNGFRVPSRVEASWHIEGREFVYARFRVTTLEYNVREPF